MKGKLQLINKQWFFTIIILTSLINLSPAPDIEKSSIRELCNNANQSYGYLIYDICIEYGFTDYEACEIMAAINSEALFNRYARRNRLQIITENSNTITNLIGYDIGLCQVYTGTAFWICKVYKRWDLLKELQTFNNFYDAEINIELCVMLFRWGCDKYDMTPKEFYRSYYQTGHVYKYGDIYRFNLFWYKNFEGRI